VPFGSLRLPVLPTETVSVKRPFDESLAASTNDKLNNLMREERSTIPTSSTDPFFSWESPGSNNPSHASHRSTRRPHCSFDTRP